MIERLEAVRLATLISESTGSGWTPQAVKILTDEIQTWSDPGAAYAIAADVARTWTDTWRPPLGVIVKRYNEEAARYAKAAAHDRAEARPQCDGTGWNESPIGMVPCKRCNPYMRDVYDDPPRWEKWLAGQSLADLHDAVAVVDRKLAGTTGMPPSCKPIPDPVASPMEGYWAARKGYAEQCAEDGKEPNDAVFDRMMIGLLGGAKEAAEVRVRPAEPLYDAPWHTDADAPLDIPLDVPEPSGASLLADAIAETKRRLAEDD